jgi:general secretion pathway protein J
LPVFLVTRTLDAYARAGGFTLMEVLVAMTLLALLMTALSGSIGFVGRSWDRGWETGEKSAAFSRIEGTLRRMVERSVPITVSAGKNRRFLFQGTATGVRLVAHDAPSGSAGALYVQEIVVTGTARQGRLLYRQYPFGGGSPRSDTPSEAQVLSGDFSIAFSYFGSPRPQAPPVWLDSWASGGTLPDLVQVNIAVAGETSWPPIIVHPFITAEYDCVQPTDAGLCRLQKAAP